MKNNDYLISLKNVFVTSDFDCELNLLESINLNVKINELIAIIGPNGAGKTTLIKTILGLKKISTGTIFRKNNLKIGYVPQKLKLNQEMPIDVKTFLNLCIDKQLSAIDYNYPYNIDNLINKSMHTLSGGEMQKVLLNAAILKNPDLLILDEPIQGIDINGQLEFYKHLKNIKSLNKVSIIMVSHDINHVFDITDHVICLNKHICCEGSPKTLEQENDSSFFGMIRYKHNHDHTH